jgi:hypothetical protein
MRATLFLTLALAACPPPLTVPRTETDSDSPTNDPVWAPVRTVRVTLGGAPAADVRITQGGSPRSFFTGPDGTVEVALDLGVPGDVALHASHPDARIEAVQLYPGDTGPVDIALRRFLTRDNLEYRFQDPGTPTRRDTTAQCGHCHGRIMDAWYGSAHAGAASNPTVHELYAGTVSARSEADCTALGGVWAPGLVPGTAAPGLRCYLGSNVLAAIDPSCAPNCDGRTTATAGCADCHAPGIDGQLGGRDLLQATGLAFDHGVHCDICHKVERVDRAGAVPGVGGSLKVLRPSEPLDGVLGPWEPLMFGPRHDNANPRMGNTSREHFTNGELCFGCHEYAAAPLVPGGGVDNERWSEGKLPVHTTWSEWRDGPFGGKVACNACHMPPEPLALNSADLEHLGPETRPGIPTGWPRPPGSVRSHSFLGPRSEDAALLRLAAALDLNVRRAEGILHVQAKVSNVGAGHRIPTGEPGRLVVLRVEATCEGETLPVAGGDVVPPWVGAEASLAAGNDPRRWPGLTVGDRVAALVADGWREDDGWGFFGSGPADSRGLPRWRRAGEAVVRSVDGGVALFDPPLPEGEVYVKNPPRTLDLGGPGWAAGAPGHAFARVLRGNDGREMVPHPWAVDITSDNRLAPGRSATTEHQFLDLCEKPQVQARLIWRAHPPWLAAEKRWENDAIVMAEATW